eukprot:359384-Chlamydomonas_euryale.AAC.6
MATYLPHAAGIAAYHPCATERESPQCHPCTASFGVWRTTAARLQSSAVDATPAASVVLGVQAHTHMVDHSYHRRPGRPSPLQFDPPPLPPPSSNEAPPFPATQNWHCTHYAAL